MAFKIKQKGLGYHTRLCTIASATVIAAGDLVALTSGVVTKANATSAAVGFAPQGSANGEVLIEVTVGNDFTLTGTADANFAVTNKGTIVDITAAQLIDLGASAVDVLKVSIASDAGVVGSDEEVEVQINLPLF